MTQNCADPRYFVLLAAAVPSFEGQPRNLALGDATDYLSMHH
jgi:hypothetical protein